jgi:hypothetical protein
MAQKFIAIVLFFSMLPALNSFRAQTIDPDDSFTFELSLPNAMLNKPFELIMQGLIHRT